MRTVALVLALALLVLTGCTWSDSEPGLFRDLDPGTPTPIAPATNPRLPVAGDTTWTSAEGLQVSTRIAVHAVRRTDRMTVLDWSITPLSAPGRQLGDELPSNFDPGLDRTPVGGINIVLLEPRTQRVYRPLSHRDQSQAHRCLCTPIWSAQTTLRIGETRMLQIAYPALPRRVRFVDVVAATLPPFGHVPVSGTGRVPTATHPADLSRPAEPIEPLTAPQYLRTDDGGETRRTAALRVDEIQASETSTTVRWTLRSMSGQRAFLVVPLGPPLVATPPRDAPVISTNAASGPTLWISNRQQLDARWMTGGYNGRPYLECLCTNLDIWAIGLRDAGSAAQLVTTYPALPRGTDRVSIVLPGVAHLPDLPVVAAPDGATRVGPSTADTSSATWTYDEKQPPLGWSTDQWPTPLPDPAQLDDFTQDVDEVTTLDR